MNLNTKTTNLCKNVCETPVKLGLFADVQYCDCDNGYNFIRTKERFYRQSIEHLDNAIKHFSSNGITRVLQLGDLIDGKCATFGTTDKAMKLVEERFRSETLDFLHVLGNHELYNLSRAAFCDSFLSKSLKKYQEEVQDVVYYKVQLSSKVCLIVLDCFDVSILSKREHLENDPDFAKGQEIIKANNGNINPNDVTGLSQPKYVAFNGAIGEKQLQWLEQQLNQATLDKQIVILSGHVPIVGTSPDYESLVWNNEEIVDIITRNPCVKAYLCGHDHDGNIIKCDTFIQINMPGVIESRHDQCPYAILEITEEKLSLSSMMGYWEEINYDF